MRIEEKSSSSITTITNLLNRSLQMTYLPSSMYSTADKWEYVDTLTQTPSVIRTKKIRLYPSREQATTLKKWFGTSRYVYNKIISYSKAPYCSEPLECIYNPYHYLDFQLMRNIFVTKKGNEQYINKWEFETPKEIRAYSIKEFTIRCKTNIDNIKKGNILKFRMNYKKKKNKQTMKIPKQSISYDKDGFFIYKTLLKGKIKVGKKTKKKMRNYEIKSDLEIHYDGLHYYLLIPEERSIDQSKEKDDKKIIALDPGVRTFQTGFHNNMILECNIDKEKQEKYYNKIRKLQSLRDKKMIKNPRRKILKLFQKIRNITDETHYKLINYLTKNFNDILLPSFKSQDMIQSSVLSRKTKRNILRSSISISIFVLNRD